MFSLKNVSTNTQKHRFKWPIIEIVSQKVRFQLVQVNVAFDYCKGEPESPLSSAIKSTVSYYAASGPNDIEASLRSSVNKQ